MLFEESPDKIIRDAAGFGWDLHELEQADRLKIIFTTRDVFYREVQQSDSLILEEIRRIGAHRIFVDGIASSMPNGNREIREQFHILSEGLQREHLTAMLSTDLFAREERSEATIAEELVADTIIQLRLEAIQRSVKRSVEVVKSRGQNFEMGRHSFGIVGGLGLRSTDACRRRAV